MNNPQYDLPLSINLLAMPGLFALQAAKSGVD